MSPIYYVHLEYVLQIYIYLCVMVFQGVYINNKKRVNHTDINIKHLSLFVFIPY